jgi:hypothetical protein
LLVSLYEWKNTRSVNGKSVTVFFFETKITDEVRETEEDGAEESEERSVFEIRIYNAANE